MGIIVYTDKTGKIKRMEYEYGYIASDLKSIYLCINSIAGIWKRILIDDIDLKGFINLA